MSADTEPTPEELSFSRQIDNILKNTSDWRSKKLAELRIVIRKADPAAIEEVKWKKPSKPEGVPVWSHDGILCTGEMLKHAVRLTFPKGAQIPDPTGFFNTRLDSSTVRAVDLYEDTAVDEDTLKSVIVEAAAVNAAKAHR